MSDSEEYQNRSQETSWTRVISSRAFIEEQAEKRRDALSVTSSVASLALLILRIVE